MLRKCKVDVLVFRVAFWYNEITKSTGGFHYELIR